jgi:hypothetical protein
MEAQGGKTVIAVADWHSYPSRWIPLLQLKPFES